MIGRVLGKRYELIEKIGEGGMGLVYKAKCHLLNRYVAVKILKPELTGDEEFINKFRKESLSSASLSHPNIVNIYDVGVEEGIYYIVMEYVKGKTLKEIIKERAPLPYYEIINISRQICLALEHAHSNNIIHRDIKPQNIMMTHDGIIKVGDFGIARASNSATLTNTGNVLGSVYYISPEQARGSYTDEKTDLYSLGIVMYEMATAKVPFMADSPVVVALKHIQENVIRPSVINPDVPLALEDIILKCLEKNPPSRYESAASVIKDLDRASASPNSRVQIKHDSLNDVTRVMPAIKDSYINENNNSRPVRHNNGINKGLTALVIIFITALTVGGLLMYSARSRVKDVPVPDIIGKPKDTAQQILKNYGLNMKITDTLADEQHPEGTIIKTTPDVGMTVKQNGTVSVKVSAGPSKVVIPPLTGYTLSDAILKIEQMELKKGNVIEQNSNNIEKDKVIKQFPDANTQVPKGSAIDLYVSKGPEIKITKVPQLEGVAYDKVEDILKDANLKLGSVDYKNDPSKPNNVVLLQNVARGIQVPEGTLINITVNDTVKGGIPATS